jgi:hypothetical protein
MQQWVVEGLEAEAQLHAFGPRRHEMGAVERGEVVEFTYPLPIAFFCASLAFLLGFLAATRTASAEAMIEQVRAGYDYRSRRLNVMMAG